MKKLIILFIVTICSNLSAQNLTRKVLFIGNSYTEVNNLPQIVANVAASAGDVLLFDSNTPGGYRLLQHTTNTVTQNKIMANDWDYVVLQGQSQEPIINQDNFHYGAGDLKNMIKQNNPCSTPILYMTWGRKNGDPINCPNIPVMCTYEGMDTALKNAYLEVAAHLRMEVSPVSVVWKYLRQNYPNIELYQADESHPSAAGSYAAACCFYATIFKKDPTLITFNYDLSPADAAVIRIAAKLNVYDNLSTWDYKQMPIADFTYTIGNGTNEVIFNNTMQNVDNYLWDFGDGTTSSTSLNPIHSYTNNGTYTITLTATNCDLQGVHQSTHSTVVTFCSHTPTIYPEILKVCPNSFDTITTEPADSYQWYDNGILIPGATNQSLVVTLSSMGVFNVNSPSVMTTINGCSELSKPSQVKTHQWSEFPFLYDLNVNGNVINDNQVCISETLSLDLSFPAVHYSQWYKDDIAIPFASSDNLIVTESGTYKVRVDHPLCPNMGFFLEPLSFEFIDCSLDNVELEFSESLIVSPNPAQNILKIQTQETISEINVYDLLGKKVAAKQLSPSSIDVSFLDQGIYLIKVENENNKLFFAKFIKE